MGVLLPTAFLLMVQIDLLNNELFSTHNGLYLPNALYEISL